MFYSSRKSIAARISMVDIEDSKIICKNCLSNFDDEKSNFGQHFVLFFAFLTLWYGLTRVIPGNYINLAVMLTALWSLFRGIKLVLGLGKLKACPCCNSKDLVPYSSPAGDLLKVDSKYFPLSCDKENRVMGIASSIGFFIGLSLTIVAFANGNKFQLAAQYKDCIDYADDSIQSIKKQNTDLSDGALFVRRFKLEKAEEDKKNCEILRK
jgi:hypothetical protein